MQSFASGVSIISSSADNFSATSPSSSSTTTTTPATVRTIPLSLPASFYSHLPASLLLRTRLLPHLLASSASSSSSSFFTPMRILTINAGSSSMKVALYELEQVKDDEAEEKDGNSNNHSNSSNSSSSSSSTSSSSSSSTPHFRTEARLLTSQNLPVTEDPTRTLRRYIDHADEEIERHSSEHHHTRLSNVEARTKHSNSASSSSSSQKSSSSSSSSHPPIRLVVHRIVHGGSLFHRPTLLTPEVMTKLESLNGLAPLHNPPAIKWIRAAQEACGDALAGKSKSSSGAQHVAVFDTGFFHDLPQVAQEYALPRDLVSKHKIRRYGFHGIAHSAMLQRMCEMSRAKSKRGGRMVTLQLGSGASASAILNGQPIDTSMGFTPLEGLVMATRSGDIDPALLTYIQKEESEKYSNPEKLEDMLYHKCGFLGLSGGESNDMKSLEESSTSGAKLALDVFHHRLIKYIGGYIALLGGIDTIVFGGGIGEHGWQVREKIMQQLAEYLPLQYDRDVNRTAKHGEVKLSTDESKIEVWMVTVDEGEVMVRDALQLTQPAGWKSQL